MCTGKVAKCIGLMLYPLGLTAILANLLLFLPSGVVLGKHEVTDFLWYLHGFIGAGLLMFFPSSVTLAAGEHGLCANRFGMFCSIIFSSVGILGAVYCVVISALALIGGPLCDTGDGTYSYPFRDDLLQDNYLFDSSLWDICKHPENVIIWNIVFFSILLCIGAVEAILCSIQVINGIIGFLCGTGTGTGTGMGN
ncbi:transmembrane 4 L6 family member 4-like [Microcaecilia unicolor]|uniref:Transmembrane 4 L6 family member 4-like n=1 Tax=Microcaecilia unicolor TaxID=1415580 RepID=A0A6P7XJF0_9AMPH|nr:transmembrane 4 L6 family member 4-like [Microcaecilia unicolor]